MVTWSTYLLGVGVVLLVYYSFVILVFFRKEMFRKFKPAVNSSPGMSALLAMETDVQEAASPNRIQSLVDEIEAFIDVVEVDVSPRDLLAGISRVIRKHPPVEQSALRESIGGMVAELAEAKLSMMLERDQLSLLWRS